MKTQLAIWKRALEMTRTSFDGNKICRLAFGAAALFVLAFQARPAAAQAPINPPYAQNDSASTMQGDPVTISILDNDVGISAPLDPSTIEIVSYPSNGYVDVDDVTGDVTYVPDQYFFGYDGFVYAVQDENGNTSNYATVYLCVYPDMTPPVIEGFAFVNSTDNEWVLSGTVVGDNSPWFIVEIDSNLPGVTCRIAVTSASNGAFSRTFQVPSGQSGFVQVTAINSIGVSSAPVDDFVSNE